MELHQGFAIDIEKAGGLWTISARHPATDRLHYGFFTPTGNNEDFLAFLDCLVMQARKYEETLVNLRKNNEPKTGL